MSTVTSFPSRIAGSGRCDYLTFSVSDQKFAVKAVEVRDVLRRRLLTPVPLAARQVAGLMNLRGHIVTAIDLRAVVSGENREADSGMSIVVEYRGEPYCLVVDQVGEVVCVDANDVEANPGSLHQALTNLSQGVLKQQTDLIVLLDLECLFSLSQSWAA